MEIRINNDCFSKAVSEVSKVVSSRTPLPILSGIKMIANAESLTLIGSNSDIIVEKTIPRTIDGINVLEVYQTGSVVIASKYLSEIVKKLPGEIVLKVNDHYLATIQSDEIVTNFNGINPDDYPTLPNIDETNQIRIPGDELTEIIKQTAFAASKSETKPVLTGVHFSFQQDELTCAATNSHRLALRRHIIKSNVNGSFTVPSTSLNELIKLFGDYSGELDVFITESYIVFRSIHTSLYSRLIEGSYPNITGLIPKESKTVVTLNTKQFLKGIDRACLFAGEWKNNNVNLESKDDLKLRIFSNSTEIGKIEETQIISSLSGEPEINISLDGTYLLDALKVIKEEEVRISFSGLMRPILIQPVGNQTQLHLISPVRTY